MEKNKDIEENKVAVRIHLPHEDPMLPAESVWVEAEHWIPLYALIDQQFIDRQLPHAEVDVYTRWNNSIEKEEDWTFKYRKTYIHPFFIPDYMFLKENDIIWRNTSDIANRLCIHIPTGTCFHIFRRDSISFGEDVIADKQNIFYKFSYTGEDGTVTPMIIHTYTKVLLDDDEIRHIKYDILKNGAKWFCIHLQNGDDGHWFGDKLKT